AGVFHRFHRIADEERADCRADDDDELPRLPENADMAAHRGIAAEDGSKRDNKTDNDNQEPGSFWPAGQVRRLRRRALCEAEIVRTSFKQAWPVSVTAHYWREICFLLPSHIR